MKKFEFRLEKVLEYRNMLRSAKERELAERNGVLFEAEKILEAILKAQDESLDPECEVLTMGELMLNGNYKTRLQNDLVNQRLMVLEAAQAVDEAREAYIEKAIESEVLEAVKQRRLEEYLTEAKREERKQLDELVVLRHRFSKGAEQSEEG